MSLYVITHKYPDQVVELPGYQYLYVGAFRQKERRPGYAYDDDGENISIKNANYCELTGLYWIWKNSTEENVGLAHYRRFFTHNSFSASAKYFYSVEELDKFLQKYDLILCERQYVAAKNLYENYAQYHYGKDLDLFRKVIGQVTPDYLASFDAVLNRNCYSACNMFYAKKELIDQYCEWLFPLMQVFESKIDISQYNALQARVYGYLAERLLNVWIEKNLIKTKELPMIQTDCSYKHRIRLKLDKIFKRAIREKVYYEK